MTTLVTVTTTPDAPVVIALAPYEGGASQVIETFRAAVREVQHVPFATISLRTVELPALPDTLKPEEFIRARLDAGDLGTPLLVQVMPATPNRLTVSQ